MTPHLRIHLLGEFRLFADGQHLDTVRQPRLQALMAYLLLHRHAPQPRQQIAFAFWPDSSERQAYTNLRKLIYRLRQAIPQADTFVAADTLYLGWQKDAAFSLDVAEVEQALDLLDQSETIDVAVVERLLELYQGELLPNCYDDWLLPLRRSLHERIVNGLAYALEGLERLRQYQVGLHTAQHLLRLDPLYEAAYRHLMRLRALSGDRAGALRVYHECVTVLEQELGVSPATETQALYLELRNAEPHPDPAPVPGLRHERGPLVGRQQEWQMLQHAWHQMTGRGPHMVTVWGEAGVGKTRLVEELMRWARLRPGTVAYAASYAAEPALAYAPLAQWLGNEEMRGCIQRMEELWQTELARLLPALLAQNPALSRPSPMAEDWQCQRFHEALARAVCAAPSPRLLVLDDLQWCDGETLAWLHYLLRFDVKAQYLVVGTVRTEAVNQDHPIHSLRRELQRSRQWSELALARLSQAETAVLAGHLAQTDVMPWSAQLYAETEGNPLFVVEMVRSGPLKQPAATERDAPLPPTVQAVISARLAQLSPSARRLVQLAAAMGRAFSTDVLASASELQDDELVQTLDELWQRRIVREQADDYDFSHDKIREVAYAEVPPARRRHLHARIAQALEELHGAHLPVVAGELASHFAEAGRDEEARHYYEQAAVYDTDRFANDHAIGHLGRALTLTPETETTVRYRLLQARRALHQRLGRTDAVAKDLEALQRTVDVPDDPHATLRRRAEVAAHTAHHRFQLADYTETIAAAQRAVDLARTCGAVDVAAQAYREWGAACWAQSDYSAARKLFQQALDLAREADLRSLQADCLGSISSCGFFGGSDSFAETQGYLREVLDLFQASADLAGEAATHGRLGFLIVAQAEGGYEDAQAHYDRALEISRTIGHRQQEAFSLGNLGVLYTRWGEYTQALTVLKQALTITESTRHRWRHGANLAHLGTTYLNMGDLDTARTTLEEAAAVCRGGIRVWEVVALADLGLLHYGLGQHAQARDLLEKALAVVDAYGDRRELARVLTLRGHVRRALGKLAEARTDYDVALNHHRQMEQFNRSQEPRAGLAAVAHAMGDASRARQHVDAILAHLSAHTLDRIEEVLQVYLTCHAVLDDENDPRASDLLHMAFLQLQARAATLETEAQRRQFWSVPMHQTVYRAVAAENS